MVMESRDLTQSTSFATAADSWAVSRTILDSDGNLTTRFPAIIGVPDNNTNLGAFNLGIIGTGRTIKQALQDVETALDGRLKSSNGLSELNTTQLKSTARSNLGLGSSATWNVGTSGTTIPLLSTANAWNGKQSFNNSVYVSGQIDVDAPLGSLAILRLMSAGAQRWVMFRDSNPESGSNNGSNFMLSRCADSGAVLDSPLVINRATGVVSLSQPLPITSGGTGANSLTGLKTTLSLQNVDNTSDANKPVSTAQASALSGKYDKTGGVVNGPITSLSSMLASGYIKSSQVLVCDGYGAEGGQLVLGYTNTVGLLGQASSTWNVDVSGVNALRMFTVLADGSTPPVAVTINPNGQAFFESNQSVVSQFATGGSTGGIAIQLRGISGSTGGTGVLDVLNENAIPVARIQTPVFTDGSSVIDFSVSNPGTRTSDHRLTNLTVAYNKIVANVPIDGRAYPRRADGANLNFTASVLGATPTSLLGMTNSTDVNLYTPSNLNVGNSTNLNNKPETGFIKRSNDINYGNGSWSRQLVLGGNNPIDNVWSAPIEIREINQVNSTNTASAYAPGLLFHWADVTAGAIKLWADGSFRFQTSSDTAALANAWMNTAVVNDSIQIRSDGAVNWNSRGRGLVVADSGASYGNVNVSGSGLNGWQGWAINNWASFMSNGTDVGIHSPAFGDWLLRFDSNRDAFFPRNVAAYSDERLKDNKRPIDNVRDRRRGMAKAAMLYERHDTPDATRIGFGAQTLQKTNPELVFTSNDLAETLAVNYSDGVALLAADADILDERITTLEEKIARLEALLAAKS